jgi:hypothetical protein
MHIFGDTKDQIILADFWVPHDIESCNFQNLFGFGFPETSQNLISFRLLISFRQLIFSSFHRGTLWENLKTPEICQNNPYLWPR